MSVATRKSIPPVVRFEVFQRDNFRCIYCGATKEETKLVVDHVIPVRDGGTNDMGNLATACQPCNAGKAARSVILPAEGEVVGRGRAKLAARWLPHLRHAFVNVEPAEAPYEKHFTTWSPSKRGGEEIASDHVVRFMPNFTARTVRSRGWRGEAVTISFFPHKPIGGFSEAQESEIIAAVISGYDTDAVIVIGEPDDFFAICVHYRYKGCPIGYFLDDFLFPEADWECDWYPDECFDFVDPREGHWNRLHTFNREDKTYGF
jgi:hypothetical protein